MSSPISRRHVLAAPLALASCRKHQPYFGKATPPTRQSLIYEIGGEPTSLDPATSFRWLRVLRDACAFRGPRVAGSRYARTQSCAGYALQARAKPHGVHIFPARAPESDRDEIVRPPTPRRIRHCGATASL